MTLGFFLQNFFRVMQNELTMQMNYLQQEIYDGKIADTFAPQQMSTYFYDRPTTVKRRNAYIVPKSSLGACPLLPFSRN